MKVRLLLVLALITSSGGRAAGGAPSPQAADADGIRSLLLQLERTIQAGDASAYGSLLSQTADGNDASEFAKSELSRGVTRVVLKERDREPLLGTLPGDGYRLSIDAFTEFGSRARSATWTLDVKRTGDGSVWRINGQQRLSAVENLYRLSLNPANQYDARNLTISFEDLELTLAEGTVFVAETDQGPTGLVALGRGEMRFHPSPEVEKGQLKIFSGSEALQTRFDAVFIRMNPQQADDVLDLSQLTKRTVDPRDLRRAEEIFREEIPRSYAIDLSDLSRDVWSLLPSSGDVVAEIRTARYETLTYTRSGAEAEDLSLFDRKRRKNINVYSSREKLAQRGRAYNEDDLVTYDVLDYDIETSFSPDRQWIDGRAKLQLRVQSAAVNSLTLRLAESLVVQSIASDRFGRLPSFRVRNQNSLVVNLPSVMLRDDEMTLSIAYAGRLEPQREDTEAAAAQGPAPPPDEQVVLQPEKSYLYSNRSYWYPQATVNDFATARMRLIVPAAYECVASGDLAEGFPTSLPAKDAAPARKVYEFTTSQPLRYLAFVVSRFVRAEAATTGPNGLNRLVLANPRQARRGREMGDRARDIAEFYQSILGDYPFPSFTLALVESDLPGGHSPGYFAVLNQPLPTSPVVWRNDPASFDDYPEFFLAHELAHQWWGQAVGWRNYHEQWLSEGFAQYFAALYAQHARGDERFVSMLRQFRRWGIQQSDDGPIYLGYRLGHIRSDSRIFRALVYNKSAAVLHMLRRLIGDEEFFRGMRRFYDSARFRKVGTDDLRAAMEAEAGQSLERFFDRWIYGSTLPRLKFTYRTDTPGAQTVVLRVEQTTAEIFDLPVTVVLQYADRREQQILVKVTDRVAEMSVPLTGTLRRADVSRDDGTLAELAKN
jgi:aminopeptidase N